MSHPGLRILYIHRTRSRDGQSVHIDELVAAFRDQGHRVQMVGPRRIGAMTDGVERKLLPMPLYELAELGYSLVEFWRLLQTALKQKPDFIYQRSNVHMLGAVWAARLLKVPLFLEINAPLARERGRSRGFAWPALARWSEKYLWRHADILLPVTDVMACEVASAGVDRGRIVTMPNGVNLARFGSRNRTAAKALLGLDNRLVLGFVGFVREWHGLEHVIDLLAAEQELAKAHLLVVGDGPALPALAARAERNGVGSRVFFTGVVAHDDVANLASAFDIALQPDVTPYASPLKLFEYMALGHAIVAPDTPNMREILSDGDNALLFAPGNYDAFAAKVRCLANDHALRQKTGEAAMCDIKTKDRTWEGNARRIASLLPEAVNRVDIKALSIAPIQS
jgi:glycosyltransferase involved in cell wall biosynthesis